MENAKKKYDFFYDRAMLTVSVDIYVVRHCKLLLTVDRCLFGRVRIGQYPIFIPLIFLMHSTCCARMCHK